MANRSSLKEAVNTLHTPSVRILFELANNDRDQTRKKNPGHNDRVMKKRSNRKMKGLWKWKRIHSRGCLKWRLLELRQAPKWECLDCRFAVVWSGVAQKNGFVEGVSFVCPSRNKSREWLCKAIHTTLDPVWIKRLVRFPVPGPISRITSDSWI